MSFSYEEYADMHFVYGVFNGNTTAAVEEYRLRYPWRRIPDRRVFTRVHQHLREKGSFLSVNRHAERQVQRNVDDDEHIIDMVQRSPRTSTEEFLPSSVFRAWDSGERCSHMEYIRTTSNAFSILNLRTCVAGLICAVGLIKFSGHTSQKMYGSRWRTLRKFTVKQVRYFSTVM
jgi:hypothetical protein